MSLALFIAGLNLGFLAGCWWASRKKAQDLTAEYFRGFASGMGTVRGPSITIGCSCDACRARRKQREART